MHAIAILLSLLPTTFAHAYTAEDLLCSSPYVWNAACDQPGGSTNNILGDGAPDSRPKRGRGRTDRRTRAKEWNWGPL